MYWPSSNSQYPPPRLLNPQLENLTIVLGDLQVPFLTTDAQNSESTILLRTLTLTCSNYPYRNLRIFTPCPHLGQ